VRAGNHIRFFVILSLRRLVFRWVRSFIEMCTGWMGGQTSISRPVEFTSLTYLGCHEDQHLRPKSNYCFDDDLSGDQGVMMRILRCQR